MLRRVRAVILICVVRAVALHGAEDPDHSLSTLRQAGDHQAVVEEAARLLGRLREQDLAAGWTLDFKNRGIYSARIGQRYIYFISKPSGSRKTKDVYPHLHARPEHVFPGARSYDWVLAITCMDGTNGKRLWTRHEFPNSRYALDHRDDSIWIWGYVGQHKLKRVDPSTGNVVFECDMPVPQSGRRWVRGIAVDAVRLWGQWTANDPADQSGVEFLVAEKRYRNGAPHPALLSPNRLRVLKGTALYPNGPYEGPPLWKASAGVTYNTIPAWLGGDVYFVSGPRGGPWLVHRVDGQTGEQIWQNRLQAAPLTLGQRDHAGWSTLGAISGYLAVLCQGGEMRFLDMKTGELRLKRTIPGTFKAFPRIIEDRIVLAGSTSIAAIPLTRFLSPPRPERRIILTHKFKSLQALARHEEALATARELVACDPRRPDVWTCLAEVAASVTNRTLFASAEVRRAQEDGTGRSADLRLSDGLCWTLPTAPVKLPLVQVGGMMLMMTEQGELLHVSPADRVVLDREYLPGKAVGLRVDGNRLVATGLPGTLRFFGGVRPTLFTPDATDRVDFPKGMPRQFNTRTGYDRPAVRIGSRWVRPLHKGRVRVTDGKTVNEYGPGVPVPGTWTITTHRGPPLGYGSGGVYALDDRFRPARQILNSRRPIAQVHRLIRCRNYLGVVLSDSERVYRLQLRRPDGEKQIREIRLRGNATGLRVMRDGLLMSGNELIWMPFDTTRPPWHFKIMKDPVRGEAGGWVQFGMPRIRDDLLVTAAVSGGLYTFDQKTVTNRPPQTAVSP